ncbi:hypothetical protein SAMN05216532_1648 [Streptomyces sp. 2231.1]|nr:hypothetical protein SAMN05216532_1648 [Streptomyces sp. 2231.1]
MRSRRADTQPAAPSARPDSRTARRGSTPPWPRPRPPGGRRRGEAGVRPVGRLDASRYRGTEKKRPGALTEGRHSARRAFSAARLPDRPTHRPPSPPPPLSRAPGCRSGLERCGAGRTSACAAEARRPTGPHVPRSTRRPAPAADQRPPDALQPSTMTPLRPRPSMAAPGPPARQRSPTPRPTHAADHAHPTPPPDTSQPSTATPLRSRPSIAAPSGGTAPAPPALQRSPTPRPAPTADQRPLRHPSATHSDAAPATPHKPGTPRASALAGRGPARGRLSGANPAVPVRADRPARCGPVRPRASARRSAVSSRPARPHGSAPAPERGGRSPPARTRR